MRILRVAQKLYPDVAGGAPYHVHALSRDQAAIGHDVTVLTVRRDPSLPRSETRDGYRIERRDATVSPLGNDISVGLARCLGSVDEYDVVHAHSHLYASTNLTAAATRLRDVPLAITNHGLFSQTAPTAVFEAYLRTLGRWTFDAADLAFCYTAAERDRLRSYGVSTPIEVVANGIDTRRFAPDGPADDRVAGDPAVLFVGRFVDGKRPRDAVDAVARLRNRRGGATLTLCGEGPLEDAVAARAAELGCRDAVRLLGQVPYDAMPGIYRAADALVLPSRDEGVPRTVLEALACGVPVVTTDLEQFDALLDGVGRTVPVGDVGGLAAALDAVVAGTERDPRSAVAPDHAWDRTVTETTAALERLGGSGG